MLPYGVKRTYYFLMRYPMRFNGWIYKVFRCPQSGLKVQLGPGQNNYLNGWLNVDANFITARIDLWTDFTKRLPFKDNSVELIYSYHVIEHLPDLQGHFHEMFRVLRPGGGIRVGGPHMGNACRKYVEGEASWFSDFPHKRESVGGRFTNFIFAANEHLTALDETYLTEVAINAGFSHISFCLPTRDTTLGGIGADVFAIEGEGDFIYPHTIILEATKG